MGESAETVAVEIRTLVTGETWRMIGSNRRAARDAT
jgi:hypothetical protein